VRALRGAGSPAGRGGCRGHHSRGRVADAAFARECPFVIDGALVLNGIAVVAKAAEMALALRRLTGSVVSCRGTYAKASAECVEEFLRNRW
jgi:hypothetical protein